MHRLIFAILTMTTLSACAQQDLNTVARGAGEVIVRAVAQSEIDNTLGGNDTAIRGLTAEQRDYCESRGTCLAIPASNPGLAIQQIRENRQFYERYAAEANDRDTSTRVMKGLAPHTEDSVVIQRTVTIPASLPLPDLSAGD